MSLALLIVLIGLCSLILNAAAKYSDRTNYKLQDYEESLKVVAAYLGRRCENLAAELKQILSACKQR